MCKQWKNSSEDKILKLEKDLLLKCNQVFKLIIKF